MAAQLELELVVEEVRTLHLEVVAPLLKALLPLVVVLHRLVVVLRLALALPLLEVLPLLLLALLLQELEVVLHLEASHNLLAGT